MGMTRTRPRRPDVRSPTKVTAAGGRFAGGSARLVGLAAVAVALGASIVPFVAWLGLGVHRHADPSALAAAAMALVYGPPLAMAWAARPARRRPWMLAGSLCAWSIVMFLAFPVYFPGERRQAVATGLGLLGIGSDQLPQRLAASLPDEPAMATPEVAEAHPLEVDGPPPASPLTEDQIALPYEGEGRRLSVPVIFGSNGRETDVEMMFDTGATYTTLPAAVLARLGVRPRKDDPAITLHTANGERDAQIVLLDSVWLGDLRIDGVAIAVCDDCASSDVSGLLGLNVASGFNVAIDADRREVVFTRRANFDRKLDVKPFADLAATFTRFPGGRVEVAVKIANAAPRDIASASTSVRCADQTWTVDLGPIPAGETGAARRKLPVHPACDQYEIALLEARW